MAATKVPRAEFCALAVSVICPHCRNPQPAPDNGSDMWEPAMIRAKAGRFVCSLCDEVFVIKVPRWIEEEIT